MAAGVARRIASASESTPRRDDKKRSNRAPHPGCRAGREKDARTPGCVKARVCLSGSLVASRPLYMYGVPRGKFAISFLWGTERERERRIGRTVQLAAATARHTKLPQCQTDTDRPGGYRSLSRASLRLPGTRGSFSRGAAGAPPIRAH